MQWRRGSIASSEPMIGGGSRVPPSAGSAAAVAEWANPWPRRMIHRESPITSNSSSLSPVAAGGHQVRLGNDDCDTSVARPLFFILLQTHPSDHSEESHA